jgi:hypothetical protein
MPALVQSLITAQSDGAALTNTLTATSLLPAQAKLSVPANFCDYVGRKFRISAQGRISNVVTTPGNLTLDLRMGGTVIFNGSTMQLSTTAHTNVPWWWDVELTVRTTGSAGNFMGQSKFISQAASISGADPTTGHSILLAPNTAPAVGGNVDLTAAQQLDLFATWSVANASNSIQLHQFEVLTNILY